MQGKAVGTDMGILGTERIYPGFDIRGRWMRHLQRGFVSKKFIKIPTLVGYVVCLLKLYYHMETLLLDVQVCGLVVTASSNSFASTSGIAPNGQQTNLLRLSKLNLWTAYQRNRHPRSTEYETCTMASTRAAGMASFMNSDKFSDITIEWGKGHQFKAHKVILAAKSGWFHTAFTSGFKVL